jgi:hypothetical protein
MSDPGRSCPDKAFRSRRLRWLYGAALYYLIVGGAVYGGLAPHKPWWFWTCVAFIAFQILKAIPGRIRNGYWGASASTSAWEQMKAEEKIAANVVSEKSREVGPGA